MNNIIRVNLHTHSTISDGLLNPKDLVKVLHDSGVKVFALTDHDKINGLVEAKAAADYYDMQFVTGIEISTRTGDLNLNFLNPNVHSIHLLGLGFDMNELMGIYQKRESIKSEKLSLLNRLLIDRGYNLPIIDNIKKKTQIAEALIDNGYASSIQDAFNDIINHFYDRWTDELGVIEAVKMIHQSKGTIIWAHPYEILENNNKIALTEIQIDQICYQLKQLNIDGIEVYYKRYSDNQITYLKSIKEKYGFISSAGTDYHAKEYELSTYIDVNIVDIKGVIK